jgi:hypothetical protein
MKQLLVLIFTTLVLIGCKKDDVTSVATSTSSTLTVSPSDNQTSVSQDATITLSFDKTVDKTVVENNFRLINSLAYVDSLCPVSKTMNHGTMAMSMMDSNKMNHLDSIHGMKGTFTWSADNKTCYFKPDTLLRPGMQHMVHLRETLSKMMETNMGSMGTMGRSGMGNGMGMSFHFTTKSSGGLVSDHATHHP